MSKHTPGPWKVATTWKESSEGRWDIRPWDRQAVVICEARHRLRTESINESLANAALIAAAPDLLAACEAAESVIAALDLPSQQVALETIRAAIRRARGE